MSPDQLRTPWVFMSYSHDSEEHRNWVAALAERLRANGVDVCLDRWDVTLGGNLTYFMERTANTQYRVIVVVSEDYTRKADSRAGGAGVEAQMLSSSLYENLGSNRVIPIIRNNPEGPKLPAFLSGRRWEDFRDDAVAEVAYEKLLREIHGHPIEAAPPLGPNPFLGTTDVEAQLAIRNSPSRWHHPGMTGEVEFTYSQNSGKFTLGSGPCQFTLELGYRDDRSVYVLNDPADILNVAVIERVATRPDVLRDVSQFDTSSRIVDAAPGDAIVLHNEQGYWAIVTVHDIYERAALNTEHVIRFHYSINSGRSPDFTSASSAAPQG